MKETVTNKDKHDTFRNLGREDFKDIDMKNYRKLSPYVTLVGTLHSMKWSYAKTRNGEKVESGKTVGYRFMTTKTIKGIIRFEITKGCKAYTTDPSCYKKAGTFNVKAGETFDLNLFETMIFFMRDDIFGIITGGDFDVYLFTRSTKNDFVTAGLRASGTDIKKNEIYIDEKVDDELVLKKGFEQYASIYTRKTRNSLYFPNEDTQAINVLGLRKKIDENIWKVVQFDF